MAVEQTIRDAIATRAPVVLTYAGSGDRTVHPHVLYVTSTGKVCAHSYQVDGYTSSGGPLPEWRPFDLAKIDRAELLDGRFDVAPGLNLSSEMYANGILAHIEP
ncbi:MAG TPA: hypothetical protein VFJ57_01200 [Solirubrobacterales bacterium]|nr:hypothetical protein [Solirubrobacterales bacterium]